MEYWGSPALGRLRQVDRCEFLTRQDFIVRLYHRENKTKRRKRRRRGRREEARRTQLSQA